ncbi:TerC/Alx family metal homeostasis membrane protein [Gulosibacter macacae]|uniref:TerC/Alx family metal homeostasis membrane protein n=1 Tax=Gulosibacter macacae TaxID=2488791 RepID=A0A3P3VWY4_9MICO|nr:TerC/Alx family metal homeostasis membrane protein [Gulosibacter macacae]RRJ86116.1 TerC/Alx family metal homeostasis membrane protein [Gulosibacter macacae]
MGHVDIWIWAISVAVVVGFFFFDFYSHVKHAHVPSMKEAGMWSLFYIAMAFVFMFLVAWLWDWNHAGDFITGYATEKALSVDNLFVFLLLMTSFKVPDIAQQKVLLIGIAIALVMRTAFIIGGALILEAWAWVFYIFGAWLLFMAVRQFIDSFKDEDPEMPGWVQHIKRFVPASDHYNDDKWKIVENGKKMWTPLILVVIALGFTDLLFALDSIPAIFGITQEPYLVFMANALALLGLRQLYFLIQGLLARLAFLDLGLAFILGFIGVKLVFHALHVNEVPFINGGEPVLWVPEIPTWFSLVFIFGTLAIAAVTSLIYAKGVEVGKAEASESTESVEPTKPTEA